MYALASLSLVHNKEFDHLHAMAVTEINADTALTVSFDPSCGSLSGGMVEMSDTSHFRRRQRTSNMASRRLFFVAIKQQQG
ncbi:MAG: hypothetical protein WA231_22140, partial [Methylocella sp.]